MIIKKINIIREKIKKDKPSIGTWQQIPHPSISEILAKAGYDWVVVDMEHGSISLDQLPDLFRGIEIGGAIPLVRLAESTPKECKQALDAGCAGIIAPMIQNANHLLEVIENCCWPPRGKRGVGYSRANLYGKHFEEYKHDAQEPFIVAQIEHINAVDNLDKILQVKGLDAIIVGPYDLSASMGITGEFENRIFLDIMSKIIKKCEHYKIPCGDHIVEVKPELLQKRIKEGYRFLAYGTDGIFLNTNIDNPIK